MRNRSKKQRGSVLLIFMCSLIPLCALAGFVADLGFHHFTQEAATTAAEAAALAAVGSVMDGIPKGGTYTCGSQGLVCQAETACPATEPTSITTSVQSACTYATINGFSQGGLGGKQTVTIEANTTSPATYAPGVSVPYWVTVHITQQYPLTLLAVLGQASLLVDVRSTAAVAGKIPSNCVNSLDPTASSAFEMHGTPVLTLTGCSAQVNSDASKALVMNGTADLNAQAVNVVGGASGNGVSPSPKMGAPATPDPFSAVAAPTVSTACGSNVNVTVKPNAPQTLNSGTYCGGLTIQGSATFNPGTYVLLGGGLSCNGQCSMTGSGVTFYNTCTAGTCGGGSTGFKGITVTGTGSINLSAPTSGPLAGMLFFEDRTVAAGQTNTFSGGSNSAFGGVLYFPNSALSFSGGAGGSGMSTVIVADTVSFGGNSSMTLTTTIGSPAWSPSATLLQ